MGFARLWRLIESRMLPLVGHIDRVTVERVAFDVLAGKYKKRQKLSPDVAEKMYWEGPQYGFASRLEMLREEFDGRVRLLRREGREPSDRPRHAAERLPVRLVLQYPAQLPAMQPAEKSSSGCLDHEEAYTAYAAYVDGLNRGSSVPHVYHTIKKGLLGLRRHAHGSRPRSANHRREPLERRRRPGRPRILGRCLADRLGCQARASSGRHTAWYRSIVLSEYDKKSDAIRNHAIDAILLARDFPSAPAMEGGRCDAARWMERVKDALSCAMRAGGRRTGRSNRTF